MALAGGSHGPADWTWRKVSPETRAGVGGDGPPAMACDVVSSGTPDCSITKFLNRILGLEVHKQNALFQYFSDTFDHLIAMDKKEGRYDMGILGERQAQPGRKLLSPA